MITSSKVVKRKISIVTGLRDEGSYVNNGRNCFDQQFLIREWRLFGIRIWFRTLDSEVVPVFASAQKACFGSTDWKSKFCEYF